MCLRGGGTPTLIFSEAEREKTKPNRSVERTHKMRNLLRCHCLQQLGKYEQKNKKKHTNCQAPSRPPPLSSYRVKEIFHKKSLVQTLMEYFFFRVFICTFKKNN